MIIIRHPVVVELSGEVVLVQEVSLRMEFVQSERAVCCCIVVAPPFRCQAFCFPLPISLLVMPSIAIKLSDFKLDQQVPEPVRPDLNAAFNDLSMEIYLIAHWVRR